MYIKNVDVTENEMIVSVLDAEGDVFKVAYPKHDKKPNVFNVAEGFSDVPMHNPMHNHLKEKIYSLACEFLQQNQMINEIIDVIMNRVTLNRIQTKTTYGFVPILKKGTKVVVAKEINRILNKHLFSDKKTVNKTD